ncbi:hypothetical protein TD95_000494 [Thielaviopsis punctulata]|uniref:NAD+ kinase n=1 Tax=Thielaviopsis punctulata TaxID=72032 RepID=A0A0F4ZAR3_9PEZI|nr:hypothetical protein TD95_000494 [Thielaviopsis punctulata]
MAEPGQRSDGDDVVEVHFKPSGAHRRKSSMQSSDPPASMIRAQRQVRPRPLRPAVSNTDCIVHQFFESQLHRRNVETHLDEISQDADAENSATDSAAFDQDSESDFDNADTHKHEVDAAHGGAVKGVSNSTPVSLTPTSGLASRPVGQAGFRSPPQLEYPQDCDGQPDEQAWVGAMHKSLPRRRKKPSTAAAGLVESAASASASAEVSLHSRHLTKRQLTDMVWGVRELSRRLGSVRIKAHVRSIFVLTKIHDTTLIDNTRTLVHWLLHPDRSARYVVYIEKKLALHPKFRLSDLRSDLGALYRAAGNPTAAGEVGAESHGRLRFWTEAMCREKPETFDFCITLGGDGTVLYVGWLFQRVVPPVVTFSLGSLGFLTKFDFARFQDTLSTAFSQGVMVSLRLRFECTVMRSRARIELEKEYSKKNHAQDGSSKEDTETYDSEAQQSVQDHIREILQQRDIVEELIGEERDNHHTHQPDVSFEILNEVVVDRGPNPTMSYTEIFGDNEHFTSVLADGVCVSTPTGSTAYNLAAGGSLCHPDNPVMLVTSICAHALSFRPIILPDTIVLRIGVPYNARTCSWASFDGRDRLELRPGDYVTISASRYPFASVLSDCGGRSEDWVNSIRGKLGWNTRQKQKAFDS